MQTSTGLAMPIHTQYAAAEQYSIHELPIADLYRWSWGRWRVSESE